MEIQGRFDSRSFAALTCFLARRRFFVERVEGDSAELTGDDARHLVRVLRAEIGQRYELSDHRQAWLAEISAIGPDRAVFHILEAVPAVSPTAHITLLAALFKFDRFEWLIEKATELGVARIVPVITERTEKGLGVAAGKRIERWKKIVHEAAQQSRRIEPPSVVLPENFSAALARESRYRYFLDELPGVEPLLRALPPDRFPSDDVVVFTGPEGGWTSRERAAASDAGWKPVSLANSILRSETAAIAALSIVSNAWYAAY